MPNLIESLTSNTLPAATDAMHSENFSQQDLMNKNSDLFNKDINAVAPTNQSNLLPPILNYNQQVV